MQMPSQADATVADAPAGLMISSTSVVMTVRGHGVPSDGSIAPENVLDSWPIPVLWLSGLRERTTTRRQEDMQQEPQQSGAGGF